MQKDSARKLVALALFLVAAFMLPEFLLPTLDMPFVSLIHPWVVTYLVISAYAFFTWVWKKHGLSRALVVLGIVGGGIYVLGLQSRTLGYHPAFGWGFAVLIALAVLWPTQNGQESSKPSKNGQKEVRLGDVRHEVDTPSGKLSLSLSELVAEMERYSGLKSMDALAQTLGERNRLFKMIYDVLKETGMDQLKALRIAAKAANIPLPDLEEKKSKSEPLSDVEIDSSFGEDIQFV